MHLAIISNVVIFETTNEKFVNFRADLVHLVLQLYENSNLLKKSERRIRCSLIKIWITPQISNSDPWMHATRPDQTVAFVSLSLSCRDKSRDFPRVVIFRTVLLCLCYFYPRRKNFARMNRERRASFLRYFILFSSVGKEI